VWSVHLCLQVHIWSILLRIYSVWYSSMPPGPSSKGRQPDYHLCPKDIVLHMILGGKNLYPLVHMEGGVEMRYDL
jgi:hypothetical protein